MKQDHTVLNSLVKANHIPHIKRFEILVYELTNNHIYFVGCKPKTETVVLHDESSPQSQHANKKIRPAGAWRQLLGQCHRYSQQKSLMTDRKSTSYRD